MIKEKLGHRIDGWIHTLFPFLFWRPINPDVLTLVGMLIAAAAGLAFAEGAFRLAGGLLVAGGFFDLVDGVVARHFEISTRFGAFLDSSLDRVVDILVMLGLLIFYVREPSWVGVALCAVILVASVLTSYAKARAEQTIEVLEGGIFERGERVGVLAAGAIFGFMPLALWVLAAGTIYTVAQRFHTAYRAMESLDAGARETAGGHS